MGVGVSGCAVAQNLRDGLRDFHARNIEVHGVREETVDVASALGARDVRRQEDDGGLVCRNFGERDGHFGRRAVDLRSGTEGTVRGVVALVQTGGRHRVGHEVGVILRVLVHHIAVEVPGGTRGDLVDDRCTGDSCIARREDDTPHNGLVFVAIRVLGKGQPPILLVARHAGRTAQHGQLALHLLTQLNRVGLISGARVVGEAVRRNVAVPLRGRLDLLVEDDGHLAVSTPGTTADDNTAIGDNLKLAGNVRAQDALTRCGVHDRRVVGEVVARLHASLGLPREFDAQVPPVTNSVGLSTAVVHELSVVPIQCDLVAHIRGRLRAAQGSRGRRGLSANKLRQTKETQNQCESRKKDTEVTALQGNHRKLLSTG